MKTLHEVQTIENYLAGKLPTPLRLLFEARMLVDSGLARRVKYQRRLHAIVTLSGRQKIKAEIDRIHQQLFTDPARRDFQQKVFQLFSKI